MKNYTVPNTEFPCRLAPGLFMLGNYFFNLFLIVGQKRAALFEVGVSAVVDTVIRQIRSVDTAPDFILPSHPHSDHMTGLPGLMAAFPDAAALIPEAARDFVEHPKAGPAMVYEDRFLFTSLPGHGVTPDRPPLSAPPDLSGTASLDCPASLDLGGLTLELHRADGHAPGNVIAHIPEIRTVLCSDSLGFHFPGRTFFPLFFTGLDGYRRTLDFIRQLHPRLICPGHQLPIRETDIPRAFADIDDSLNTLVRQIDAHTGQDDGLIGDLYGRVYRDEFSLYSPDNIENCIRLLIRRAREAR